jgi:hypothetical protein
MITLLLHVANSEPVKVDVEEMPSAHDSMVIGKNPRQRNDKEFEWVDEGVSIVAFPLWRINYIQILPGKGDEFEDLELPFRD